jgi:wyosine [tRNA(Phe)-imidazoG37] synthetase (radical SAM superfamily)
MKTNTQLHAIIKLRHLKSASQNNWEMLNDTKKMVNEVISEAQQLMRSYGNSKAKEQFSIDSISLSTHVNTMQTLLNDFHEFIQDDKSIDIENSFEKFSKTLNDAGNLFDSISTYPQTFFEKIDVSEWKEIWNIIKSNLSIMQGIGESAYIKSLMMKNFNKSEVDTLTNEIIKHIPQSFNLLDADKYKQDYLQAVKEIKQENNAKDNLWDRFLNILAGGIPFKQTPEERVMMRRWIDGERGEL